MLSGYLIGFQAVLVLSSLQLVKPPHVWPTYGCKLKACLYSYKIITHQTKDLFIKDLNKNSSKVTTVLVQIFMNKSLPVASYSIS